MKNIFIQTFACRRRLLDARRIESYFVINGHNVVNNPEKADIIIFLACGFHGVVASKNFNKIKELQKYNAKLIVAGCLPINEKENLSKYFDGITIGTKELNRDDSKIDSIFPENKIKFNEIEDGNLCYSNSSKFDIYTDFLRKSSLLEKIFIKFADYVYKHVWGEKSFSYVIFPRKPQFNVRIADGCNCKCTYCVIRKSSGPFHSKPLDTCIGEFKKGLSRGYKKFVISAVDTGCYGTDINSSFPELLDAMVKLPGDFKITIRAFNPTWLIKHIDELEAIFKSGKIRNIAIPIQSASPRILKLMKRSIDLEKLKNALNRLRTADPDMILETHFMIGFPTETEENFQQTLNFVKDINSEFLVFFRFSLRPGTEIEHLEPQITSEQIELRVKKARKFLKNLGYIYKKTTKLRYVTFVKRAKYW